MHRINSGRVRRWRAGLALFAALTMIASAGLFAAPALAGKPAFAGKGKKHKFDDEGEAAWASVHIQKAAAKGLFKGYEDGNFRPGANVNRAEVVVLAVRLMGKEETAKTNTGAPLPYTDLAATAAWAAGYIDLAIKDGLLERVWGDPHVSEKDRAFQPNKPATRLEVAVILLRAMSLKAQAEAADAGVLTFKDVGQIDEWVRGYVALALERGIVTGYEDKTFRPNQPVKRSEMAALLDRGDDQHESGVDGEEIEGTLVAVDAAARTVTIKPKKGAEATYSVAEGASIFVNKAAATLADLAAGHKVEAVIDADLDGAVIYLKQKGGGDDEEEAKESEVEGTVTEISAARIVLDVIVHQPPEVGEVVCNPCNFDLASSVTVKVGDTKSTDLSLVKVGDKVEVKAYDGKVFEIKVEREDEDDDEEGGQQPPAQQVEFTGTVKSVDATAGRIVVTVNETRDGQTVQVDKTVAVSAQTTYKKADGTAGTLADVAVNARVEVKGTAGQDGVIAATAVELKP